MQLVRLHNGSWVLCATGVEQGALCLVHVPEAAASCTTFGTTKLAVVQLPEAAGSATFLLPSGLHLPLPSWSAPQECRQECPTRLFHKSVRQECPHMAGWCQHKPQQSVTSATGRELPLKQSQVQPTL